MDAKNRNVIIAIVVIILIVALFLFLGRDKSLVTEQDAKCIGENSVLYFLPTCTACQRQEAMFGDNLKYLTLVDCSATPGQCPNISHVPTWEINNQFYEGVQSIAKLKELTGC